MRGDIKEALKFLGKEEITMYNKSELARRFGCDPRTIDRYLRIQNGELKESKSKRVYHSKLDGFKEIITYKVDTYGCSARAVY